MDLGAESCYCGYIEMIWYEKRGSSVKQVIRERLIDCSDQEKFVFQHILVENIGFDESTAYIRSNISLYRNLLKKL